MARFDFSTGRLPRRVSTRGDVLYKEDQVFGKYLSICPMSLIFLAVPSALTVGGSGGMCGGRRLNQYTVVMEVMFESLPIAAILYPLFSSSAFAETEVFILYIFLVCIIAFLLRV